MKKLEGHFNNTMLYLQHALQACIGATCGGVMGVIYIVLANLTLQPVLAIAYILMATGATLGTLRSIAQV